MPAILTIVNLSIDSAKSRGGEGARCRGSGGGGNGGGDSVGGGSVGGGDSSDGDGYNNLLFTW